MRDENEERKEGESNRGELAAVQARRVREKKFGGSFLSLFYSFPLGSFRYMLFFSDGVHEFTPSPDDNFLSAKEYQEVRNVV